MMNSGSIVAMILYFCFCIGISVYLLVLLTRFVGAHVRIAQALEETARNSRRDGK